MPETAAKEKEAGKRGKVEKADTYLGVASKVLTIFAALSTLSVWLYTTYYVGTLEVKPDQEFQTLTLKLYDERGMESVYHSGRLKVAPGHYQILASTDENVPSRIEADVKFNHVTVVPYTVPSEEDSLASARESDISKDKSNRRWWQFWKRD